MADFGDYAGQYLTMAREMPRNAVTVGGAMDELANSRLQRAYTPSLMMAKFYGTPFEQQKFGVETQDVLARQGLARTAQERQYAADAETRRHNRAVEDRAIKAQTDSNALERWKAAKTAYDAGLGPDPGLPPGSGSGGFVAGGIGGQTPTVISGAAEASAAPTARPEMPMDLAGLPPGMRNKILAERLADKPAAIAKMEGLNTTMDQMIDEAKQLRVHPSIGTGTGWTGLAYRTGPDMTEEGGRNFGERLKSLGAQIGFNALQQMREMSKTGGALGQVSDFENRRLEAAISALDAQQSEKDVKRALQQVINYAEAAKKNMGAAYERTYGEPAPKFEKRDIVPPRGMAPADQEAVNWARSNPNDPRAAQILRMNGGL